MCWGGGGEAKEGKDKLNAAEEVLRCHPQSAVWLSVSGPGIMASPLASGDRQVLQVYTQHSATQKDVQGTCVCWLILGTGI